jgi:hypothetical protein
MTFTVGLPGGTRDYEFEAYIRLLEQNGVNVASTPRVVDPVTGKRWLYAWANEADAQQFVAALRQETENDKWRVFPLPNVEPTPGPLGPIEIRVSRRSDGCTYSLSPTSRNLILKGFPRANLAPTVFISTLTQSDFEKTHGPIWGQVAIILTGLSEEQIKQLGGYRIIDSVASQVFRDAPPLVA